MLKNTKYRQLTAREIKPEGWLKRQLEIQANGLSGHLDSVWPDVRDSAWIGGEKDGWERLPYWLDGFIPLAFLLENKGMIDRAKRYVEAIISRQQEDGWICPCTEEERGTYDIWTAFLIAKVLALYADCTGDEDGKLQKTISGILHSLDVHLDHKTLFDWASSRWFECLIPIFWLYERTREEWLLDLAQKLEAMGVDYNKLFADFRSKEPQRRWTFLTHVVNLAMSLKQGALSSRIHAGDPDEYASRALEILSKYHGMAAAHFTGDECISGDSPIQGTELCGVVEAMYSYETLFATGGNPKWADMLEKLAFNALPATISEDMWTHQYLQMSNQPQCSILPKENIVFRTNGEESHLFGLEPNFGCCTANFSQGWPKLAMSAFMQAEDELVSALLVPSSVNLKIGKADVKCVLKTDYPFRGSLKYTVETSVPTEFTLSIRIPSFAKSATVEGKIVPTGEIYKIKKIWQGKETVEVYLSFECELTPRPRGLFCLWRGPLLYSVPIAEQWNKREYVKNGVERKFPYCDYEIFPLSAWNYGFSENSFTPCEYEVGKTPFSHESPPVTIKTRLAKVEWPFENGVCAEVPGKEAIDAPENFELIPYGCTNLRMTELPCFWKGSL